MVMVVKIEPVNLLEVLGIDDYSIDRGRHKVYLDDKNFIEIARYFNKKFVENIIAFEKVGWQWAREGEGAGVKNTVSKSM